MKNGTIITILIYSLIFFYCTSDNLSGTAVEDGNSVSGIVYDSLNNTAESIFVTILPVGFSPVNNDSEKIMIPDRWIDTTGVNGEFKFSNIDIGKYKIICRNKMGDYGSFKSDIISVDSISKIHVEILKLSKTGSLKIKGGVLSGYKFESNVFISGTPFSVFNDSSELFFNNIPEGEYDSIVLDPIGDFNPPQTIYGSFEIKSGQETSLLL